NAWKLRSARRTASSVALKRQHELGHDQIRRQTRVLPLATPLDLDLDHHRASPCVKGNPGGDYFVAEHPCREHVELQLDRGEVMAGRDRWEGRPSGDGVAEGGPRPAVDESPRMQVALVDDDVAAGEVVLDFDRLDAEIAGEAAGQEGPDALRRDGAAWM